MGYWDKTSVILDCFGGVGLGGVIAMMQGYTWLGVELEPKFVSLANQNFVHIRELWKGNPPGQAQIIQGDSRKLREILGQAKVDGIITSPPYSETSIEQTHMTSNERGDPNNPNYRPSWMEKLAEGYAKTKREYGTTPGQLGNLKEGDLDAIITSPPYSEIRQDGGSAKEGYGGMTNYTGEPRVTWRTQRNQQNIGNLPEGNIDAILTSPPYEDGLGSHGKPNKIDIQKRLYSRMAGNSYGSSSGQIGQQSGENYWAAVRDVYAECFQILKPGGIIVVIVKSFIKNKKLVNLPDMTLKLLEHLGFETLWYIRAWQVRKGLPRTKLDGEITQKIKIDKGFFRQLYETKYPDNRIDYEVVLIMQKRE